MTKVKICCISSIEEAQMAIGAGADCLGLVGPMPSGPGTITIEQAGKIQKSISEDIESFYLTSKVRFQDIAKEYQIVRSTHIQLTDYVKKDVKLALKDLYPGVQLVQVVHVLDENSIEEAIKLSEASDYLLLDSGNPNLSVKELGGTGRVHNWNLSKDIVNAVDIPVFLAGGLRSNNVREAIEFVKPYGVDLCSGVRTNDKLDAKKLNEFFTILA